MVSPFIFDDRLQLHSTPRIDSIPPHSELYRAPHPSQQLDSPPKLKRRTMSSGHHNRPRDSASHHPSAVDDPSVDFRNFFPYIPNEVKHRKRTSGSQAKVLEGVFDRNTKPDSGLRQRLARELDMTPRGVQVCIIYLFIIIQLLILICRSGFRIGGFLVSALFMSYLPRTQTR